MKFMSGFFACVALGFPMVLFPGYLIRVAGLDDGSLLAVYDVNYGRFLLDDTGENCGFGSGSHSIEQN